MSINIVNKKNHIPSPDDVYCGRGSVVGNPYCHKGSMHKQVKFFVKTRDEACDKYEEYFNKQISDKNPDFLAFLEPLIEKYRRGENINLVCFCEPLRCHCRTIKNFIEKTSASKLLRLTR